MESIKFSLIIAKFDQTQFLCKALNAILSDGFTDSDICILSPTRSILAIDGCSSCSAEENREANDYFASLERASVHSGKIVLAGYQGILFDEIKSVYYQLDKNLLIPSRKDFFRLFNSMNRYVGNGGFVLTVITEEPIKVVGATRALLRHSSHPVQTLDTLVVLSY